MAEIRCPMCGKPNPAELDVCQFCEARLKPVTDELSRSQPPIRPGEEPKDMDTGQLESTLPRWLRDVRQQARESASQEEEQPRAEEEAKQQDKKADLLAGLGSQSEGVEEVPDWLSGLRNQAGQVGSEESSIDHDDLAALRSMLGEGPPASQESESSELPAWASDLRAEGKGGTEADDLSSFLVGDVQDEPAQTEPGPPATNADIGWQADFEADSTNQEATTGDEKPFDTDLPAWLQDTDKAPIDESASDLPAWLGGEASNPVESETASTIDEGELPAWLQDTDQAPKEETDVGLPAWLGSLGGDEATKAAPQQAPEQPEVKSTTDWLASLDEEDSATHPPEDTVSAIKSTTDWLASLDPETTEKTEAISEQEAAPPEEEMPDWLSSPGETSQQQTEEPAATDDLPGWLSAFGEEGGETAPQAEAEPLEESKTPGWLSSLKEENVPAEEQVFSPGDEFEETAQPASESQIPDWLTAMGEASAENKQPADELTGPGFAPETPAGESKATPAFVDDEGKPISPEDVEAIFSMDMPDWLSDTTEAAEADTMPEVQEAGDEGLRPADLPSWVQAMRPVESVISETQGASSEDQPMEERGPLAGLRGVLPAVPGVGPSSKPKAYSIKLQASEDQQSNAAMLEKMLAEEVYPKPVTTQKAVLSQRLLRLAISSLFLGIVAVIFFSGTRINPIPAPPAPNPVLDFVKTTLPANAPVLVVFDYQASLAGELEVAAAPLFDQMLTDKAPRLSLISSTPVGSGLAERFMKILQTNREYARDVNFVNLGYLSGGAAGVQAFSKEPKSTKQLTTNGENAWATPVLQDVKDLAGFKAIFLLTDDLETARIWIEQTEGNRGEARLFVVSSAQSGPMIMPYVNSGQIAGIVTGINDSAPIEEANGGGPGLTRRYWDAYGFGLLTAIVMIVLGSLWSLVTGRQARRKEQGEA